MPTPELEVREQFPQPRPTCRIPGNGRYNRETPADFIANDFEVASALFMMPWLGNEQGDSAFDENVRYISCDDVEVKFIITTPASVDGPVNLAELEFKGLDKLRSSFSQLRMFTRVHEAVNPVTRSRQRDTAWSLSFFRQITGDPGTEPSADYVFTRTRRMNEKGVKEVVDTIAENTVGGQNNYYFESFWAGRPDVVDELSYGVMAAQRVYLGELAVAPEESLSA